MAKRKLHAPIEHRQRRVVLKRVPVDVGIIPVVRWLNNLAHVTTEYSCQGYDDVVQRPYVLFRCDDDAELAVVYEEFCGFANIEISAHPRFGIRFELLFIDRCSVSGWMARSKKR